MLATPRAYAVAAEALAPGADLADMCTLQLGMAWQLLARSGNNYTAMRCTVYARSFTESVGMGQIKLVRVAQFPMPLGHEQHMQPQSTLLLHTEQSWALTGGSAAVDPSSVIEDCLLHREVVALPNSSALVFPLVDGGVLVGLLVAEVEPERDAASPHVAPGPGAVAAGGSSQAGTAAALLPALCANARGEEGAAGGIAGSSGLGGADAEAAGGAGFDGSPPRRRLSDEELRCLRLAVPLLAKACGMDARSKLQLAQSSLAAAAARGLLAEAARPLSTLNTFGAMLVPRLKDGEPDKDMASGILLQGKRLQDIMWQLEDALHGPGAVGAAFGRSAVPPTSAPAAPFRQPSALPGNPDPAVRELLSLPAPPAPPRTEALPAPAAIASTAAAVAAPLAAVADVAAAPHSAGGAVGATAAALALETSGAVATPSAPPAGPGPVLPGQVTFVQPTPVAQPPPHATSTSGAASDSFTLRQPSLGRRVGPLGHGAARGPYSAANPPPPGAAMATIDVEMEGSAGSCGSNSSSSSSSSSKGGDSHGSGGGGALVPPPAIKPTNLVLALAGVLTAACKLAAVNGLAVIVNAPLSTVLPSQRRRTTPASPASRQPRPHPSPPPAAGSSATAAFDGSASSSPPQRSSPDALPQHPRDDTTAAAAASSGAAGGARPPRLIPRPARPLLVGAPAALVQRVVGYVLDIALQCTPRGGQVCVSAQQDGSGVAVVLLHTGRLDLHRLHARSGPLAAAAAGAGADHHHHQQQQHRHHHHVQLRGGGGGGGGGGAAVAVMQRAPPSAAAAASMAPGSGVLSVELAQELVQQAGGHLTVAYPTNVVNARSGNLDVGTSVQIWLPGPGALN